MIEKAISDFFDERKEAWIKKNQKASMSDEEVLALHETCDELFSIGTWLPDAARRAGQMSMATHPCTFSHPSARKNKNGYVTPIIAENVPGNDGLLRSGNVAVERDALGNAAVIDVHKFLSLRLEDGRTLMEHIGVESESARQLLSAQGNDYEVLRNGFLEMVGSSTREVITSSKIKQVYFPVDDDYHQLSILSNSGIIFHLKKRLDAMRFGDEVKALREKKRKGEFSEEGYGEIYHLTTIGYGGTKPQNISVLNNQNGGKAYLLRSMPPVIEKRSVRFPKKDFFRESMRPFETRDVFQTLHKIYKNPYKKDMAIRNEKYALYQQLVDHIVEKVWAVRSVAEDQYFEESSQLAGYQKIWLLDTFSEQRESESSWLDELIEVTALWILHGCEAGLGTSEIFGPAELLDIRKVVESNREALR